MTLKDTEQYMESKDYKDRFIAEYWQTKSRYEKLKDLNNRIEAFERCQWGKNQLEETKHDCPTDLLRQQQQVMGEYLHILEVRAVIESIDLKKLMRIEASECR